LFGLQLTKKHRKNQKTVFNYLEFGLGNNFQQHFQAICKNLGYFLKLSLFELPIYFMRNLNRKFLTFKPAAFLTIFSTIEEAP